ncbi:MAG TPA: ribonuclease E/G, partial [Caulobacteraceae bacterium]|nr:ribonuclease E/G [Caulobacteraceae bacterium]
MSKKMLIDAAHAEETRVVVLDGTRVEEFDFESRAKKQLRGNIYLAKVTRVEPSLQAAFVEYGGNRHGFLAFNEIHPDYYQIPHADREALMREVEDEDDDEPVASASSENGEDESEHVGGEDDEEIDEALARLRRRMMRRYKIQEVIKRRQIMLVQVVKEERGNKGAALTTFLSLAGRYCVLMPNTDRGGGISRKITAATDRKRLRTVVQDLRVPKGMGLIVRTAGAKRTKAEIKRDYEYLMRAWENIRDTTLHSIAPALIYEEEDLVKRAIRDLYDKDLEGIWVEGEAGYREARDFMRMLMPSQAKKIQAYREPVPLFVRHRVEDHLSQIYSPVVPLRSGGYLVINQTEALVAVDVNSGRATRERNIEATALKTNMEAAEEAARQLRLRDLAGLIVIDFIDMDEAKNNRAVEKKMKDCLKDDRARVQMGKISGFGLMEISRQRRRTGILEGTTHVCPHCQGAGRVRSVESAALSALRAVEMEALRGGG